MDPAMFLSLALRLDVVISVLKTALFEGRFG